MAGLNGAEALNEEGESLLKAGNYSAALDIFNQAIEKDPSYIPAYTNRGITLLSIGRAQEALMSFEIALDRNPGNTAAWIYRGDALSALGKTEEAWKSYMRAGELEPENPVVRERLLNVRSAGPLPGQGEIPVIPLLVAGTLLLVSGTAGIIILKRRGRKGSPKKDGEEGKNFLSGISFSSKSRKKDIIPGTSAQGAISVTDKPSNDSQTVSQKKGKLLGRAAAVFKRKTRSTKDNSPFVTGSVPAAKDRGPLEMAGSELSSLQDENESSADPGNREQIIEGFDHILADSGINSAGFKGLSHYAMGNYTEALKEFDAELKAEKGDPDILVLKAAALLKMGRTDEALQCCEAAVGNGKSSFEIRKVKASILDAMGRWDDTLRACDEALSFNPHSVEVWSIRARALRGLSRYHEALQSCERAIGMDPTSLELIKQRSVLLADLGRVDDALASLDQGISMYPRDPSLLIEKGRILHKHDRLKEALKELDLALAIAPDNEEAWRELAMVLHTMKDPMEEAAAWERASALCPENIDYIVSWGDALLEGGDHLASAKVYLNGIRKSPNNLVLWNRLGKSLYYAGKFDDSVNAFKFIIKKSPDDGYAWKFLGCSLLKAGRPNEAAIAFLKADTLIPGDPVIREGLKRARSLSHASVMEKNSSPSSGDPMDNGTDGGVGKTRPPKDDGLHVVSPLMLDGRKHPLKINGGIPGPSPGVGGKGEKDRQEGVFPDDDIQKEEN